MISGPLHDSQDLPSNVFLEALDLHTPHDVLGKAIEAGDILQRLDP
jgi:hypothetical protein